MIAPLTNAEIAELERLHSTAFGNRKGDMFGLGAAGSFVRAFPALLAEVKRAREADPVREALAKALEGMLRVRDWAAKAGGGSGPLPQNVIVKFAEMQAAAVDEARAALSLHMHGSRK